MARGLFFNWSKSPSPALPMSRLLGVLETNHKEQGFAWYHICFRAVQPDLDYMLVNEYISVF